MAPRARPLRAFAPSHHRLIETPSPLCSRPNVVRLRDASPVAHFKSARADNMNRLLSIILALVMTTASVAARTSQDKKDSQTKQKDEDVIRISAELVQVDVLVTDKNKKPVSGLKQEDFELYDNDKPQKIGFFSFEESTSRKFDGSNETRTLPRVTTPSELKRVVTFVVDTMHIRADNLYRAKKMMIDFV